ncbi:hypothetical protein [Nostoc sp. CHAB 5715]|uniref:hypothetical protein n=1 Tax=Nostoc sp. CHAB 5715 TaxID=2780400 RepID=UPI001E5CE30C|nr:hypothetical protein [Nostoc sp. CHAB 5715]MCC5625386.1 hypothetical protein [Nostoc sp. CHAB 5715]
MTQANESKKHEIPNEEPKLLTGSSEYDWRDPSKPRNPEDSVIVDGWRRPADGTFEKIENTEGKE